MKRLLIALCLVLMLPAWGWGATYYVATGGVDTNNGTSTETPWAHHPHDGSATNTSAATVLSAGSQVLFKRGDTFTGVSITIDEGGSDGNPVITGSYGTGAKPILENAAAYVIHGQGIGDSYNRFQDLDIRGNGSTAQITFHDGVLGCEVINCDVLADTGGTNGYCVQISLNSVVTIQDCNLVVSEEGRGLYIYGSSGSVIDGKTITTNEDAESGDSAYVGIHITATSDSNTISNNTIGSVSNSFLYGIRLDDADSNHIYGNTITSGNQYGSGIAGVSATHTGNKIYRNTIIGTASGINIANGGGDNHCYFNLIYGYARNGIDYVVEADGVGYSLVANNTIIHSPNETNPVGHGIEIEDGTVELRNNIVIIPSTFDPGDGLGVAGVHCIAYTTGYTDIKASNNIYYPHPTAIANGVHLSQHGGNFDNTIEDFQSDISGDANVSVKEVNSDDANPQLSDITTYNFILTSTSPCKYAGTSPFVNGDGDQYDMTSPTPLKVWDDATDSPVGPWGYGVTIGAYGYQPAKVMLGVL